MYYLKTPQTTTGMNYPDETMIETCDNIIQEIENKYNDFDTAILGCGCYGAVLINILRKKYSNKNIIYLGSDCYKMFGITTPSMNFWGANNSEVNVERAFNPVESLPEGCKNHPEKKYWIV